MIESLDLPALREKTNGLLYEKSHAERQLKDEKTALEKTNQNIADIKEAQGILQSAGEHVQQKVHGKVAEIVSRCLEAVFDEPYEFKIVFEKKRGKTEAKLVFERDGYEVDPKRSSGGGVIDVASFALRLASLMLRRPQRRKLLVLDEPFKHLSKEFRPRVRELLETLSTDMDVQIIMVTHDPVLTTGKVIEIGK